MPGAGDDRPRRIAQPLRGIGNGLLAFGIERRRRIVAYLLQGHLQTALPLNLRDKRPQLAIHLVHQRIAEIAHINGEGDLPGHHVAAVGPHLHATDRAASLFAAPGNGHHFLHNAGRHLQGILTQAHRRGSGVRGLAGDHAVVPADPQHALHDTDGFRFIFENRPLLNVRLKIGADGMVPRGLLADIADLLQRLADADTLFIRDGPGLLQREDAGKDPRAHHHRHKARPLFVGPEHHLNRRLGGNLQIVERAHHLQRRQHAVVAVKFAAGGLSVDMAAGDDGRQAGVAAFPAHKYIAYFIDGDAHPGLPRPAYYLVPPLAVEIGEGQTAAAALRRGADLREIH